MKTIDKTIKFKNCRQGKGLLQILISVGADRKVLTTLNTSWISQYSINITTS